MLTRRAFLQTPALAAAAPQAGQPKRLAIVTTIYRYLSHGQHMGDRFLVGYPYGGAWRQPNIKVVSLYVDQKPEGDLSGERAQEFGFTVYPTISDAHRCGESKLAVDAVLIIGEHGNYPRNEKGRSCTRGTSFSTSASKYSKRTAGLSLSSTTSTFLIASRRRRPWWMPRGGCVFRCSAGLRFR